MASSQSIEVFKGLLVNLQAKGAVPDCRVITDAAITATDKTLTSATAPFSANSVGMVVCVNGAGTAGAALITTIASFTSTSSVELTAAAATTVSGAVAVFGTDNKAAFSSFRTTCQSAGRQYWIPSGWYLTTETVDFADGSIEIQGEARDNVASSVIVYVGTGVGVYIHPTDLGTQCFAANIKNVAIATYGGATDALKLRNLSQAILENVGIGQADGAAATTGLNLVNPNILTVFNPIIQGCSTAVVVDSTAFPFDATYVTFQGGNLYQNTKGFDIRANTVHLTIQHMHVEQFTTLLNFDKNNANLQVERLVVEDNEILGGGGTFTDATLINVLAPGITTIKIREFQFNRNRCYFIVAKENPIKFDVSATGTADINFRLRGNVFSNITTSLISTASSPTGIEIIAESNLTMFGSAWTLMAAGYNAKVYVPVYGGDLLSTANRVPFVSEATKLNADAGLTYYGTTGSKTLEVSSDNATDGQVRVSTADASRVLKISVPTAAYTAVVGFLGALSALAVNGPMTVGSNEQPGVTLYVHNADTGGHTQLQVKGNAADGALNAIVNIITSASAAALQVLGTGAVLLPLLTASRNARIGSSGELTTGAIDLTSSTDVSVGSIPAGSIVSVSSGALAALGAFTTDRILGTNASTGAVEVHKVDLGNGAHVTVPGSSTDLLVNSGGVSVAGLPYSTLESTLKTYFDTIYAAIVHTHAESDITNLTTDLGNKSNTGHTHTDSGHTHGGVTVGAGTTASGSANIT